MPNTEIFAIAATSKDGFISPKGKEADASTDWTSKEDFEYFKNKTKGVPCIMGSKTFDTILTKNGSPLPGRLNIVHTRDPQKYSHLPQDQVITTQEEPSQVISMLKGMNHSKIAICGGHTIYDQYVLSGVVDQVHQTIEPIEFKEGIPFLSKLATSKLTLKETIPLSESTVVKIFDVIK